MKKKQGISLIVLVITIIVMIILAASVIISINNSSIIDKANMAVQLTDEKQVQEIAAIAWAECYMEDYRGEILATKVKEKLAQSGVIEDIWNITVTDKGITIEKNNASGENTPEVSEKTITLDQTTVAKTLIEGTTEDFGLLAATENISGQLTWISSNESVATVVGNDKTATVTVKSEGTATITASCGEVSATCIVVVTKATQNIILDKTTITEEIIEGTPETITLTATTQNIVGTLNWVSSNPSVVSVVGNNKTSTLTLKDEGTATITASYGSVSAICTINVTEKSPYSFSLKGVWQFGGVEEIICDRELEQQISFVSNSTSYSNISIIHVPSDGYFDGGYCIEYDDDYVWENANASADWFYEEWRVVDFGTSYQPVSEEFYNWFIANAIKQ